MSNKRFHLIALLMAGALFSGCSGLGHAVSGRMWYTYELAAPVKSKDLIYRDDHLIVQFKLDESALRFQLQNVSEAPVAVDWEKASVSLNNRTYALRNSATWYAPPSAVPSSVTVPPLGYIRDMVIPRENIYQENGRWIERPFFPNDDLGSAKRRALIMRYRGSRVTLTLPVRIAEVVKEYTFTFRVSAIDPLPPNTLPPAKERPPVPPVTGGEGSVTRAVIPMIITAGVLGVAVVLLSQKKTPAGDL